MPDQPHIYLHCVNCVSAAGVTLEATKEALFSDKPKALTVYPGLLGEIALAYGLVKEAGPVTGNFVFDLTRTNRLIDLCLKGMTGLTDALARECANSKRACGFSCRPDKPPGALRLTS